MEKWKIWLIVCTLCSLICGFAATDIFFHTLATAEEQYGMGIGWVLDLWWVIPVGFILGFFIPSIAYPLERMFLL
ncbi:MAG: hypothetical protein ACFFDY_15400 [Candidatus Thorarchaeota archaeon]